MAAKKTNDYDLRRAVVAALLAGGVARDAIRHEITLDSASRGGRVDLVIADDAALFGVEIKSGQDTLSRLAEQSARYRRCFDHVTLVIDARHETAAEFGADREWSQDTRAITSVVVFDAAEGFRDVKDWHYRGVSNAPWLPSARRQSQKLAGTSPSLSAHAMLCLLWQEEVAAIGKTLFPQRFPAARCKAIPKLSELASLSQLRPLVAAALRRRQQNRWDEDFWRRYDADARLLAFRWIAQHPRRLPEVWGELRRLLGYRGGGGRGVTWADVHDLATTLIYDSPAFAARCRREVAATEGVFEAEKQHESNGGCHAA